MSDTNEQVTVEVSVVAPLETVWEAWITPEHIVQWNAASSDWHTTTATNNLEVGGKFTARMEAKDGSVGFDFGGTYTHIVPKKELAYTMGDGRKVSVLFAQEPGGVRLTEHFDPETVNPVAMQQQGWQSILQSFKLYAEGLAARQGK